MIGMSELHHKEKHMNILEELEKKNLHCGRMLHSSKCAPKGQHCVWNANIVTKSGGKVWHGDLNITKEGNLLKIVAAAIGEPIYVLREMDARFSTERDDIGLLIGKAVWSTNK